MRQDRRTQVLARLNNLAPKGMGLQVVPHQLVRVEFRRVRRQIVQLKTTVLCFDKTLHGLCPVDRMPINDKKDRCLRIDHQAPEKLKEDRCRHPSLGQHETQLTLRAHRRKHVDTEAGADAGYNWRVTAPSPGGTAMEVRTYPCLIGEQYLGPQTLRAAAQPRVVFFLPAAYGLRVLLVGSPKRALGAHAHLSQQATHRAMAQMHPEALGNEFTDHACGPQGEGKFQLQRAFAEHGIVYPHEGPGFKLGGTAATLTCIKLVPAAAAVKSEPPKDGTQVDAHGSCHRLRALARLHRGDGAFPEFG